jgi:hypothetical protein
LVGFVPFCKTKSGNSGVGPDQDVSLNFLRKDALNHGVAGVFSANWLIFAEANIQTLYTMIRNCRGSGPK